MFKFLAALSLVTAVAFAQNVDIGLPRPGQAVMAGGNLTVQVQRPNSLTDSEEVAVVLSLRSCPDQLCTPLEGDLGLVLYNGPFDPQYYNGPMPAYQNFTVQVPSSTPKGPGLIGAVHVALIGAGLSPYLEIVNQTIVIV